MGSQYSMADSVRGSTLSSIDSNAVHKSMHGNSERMTNADRMTTASSLGGRGTGYSRVGDRMTSMSDDDADLAPDLHTARPRQGKCTLMRNYTSLLIVCYLFCPIWLCPHRDAL